MYETIKRLYQEGRLTEKGLSTALKKGWITQEQAVELTKGDDQEDGRK